MPQGTKVAIFWLSRATAHVAGIHLRPRPLLRAVRTGRTDIGACLNGQCQQYSIDKLTIDAMNQIAAYVAGIKGRKNLLWFTPACPLI